MKTTEQTTRHTREMSARDAVDLFLDKATNTTDPEARKSFMELAQYYNLVAIGDSLPTIPAEKPAHERIRNDR